MLYWEHAGVGARAPRGGLVDLGAGILDRVDAAIIVVGLDGVVQYANPYCAHLYGRSPEELVGDQSSRLTVEPVTRELSRVIAAEILNGRSWEGDFAIVRPDDRVVEVHAFDSPVFDEQGKRLGRDQPGVRRDRRTRLAANSSARCWRSRRSSATSAGHWSPSSTPSTSCKP